MNGIVISFTAERARRKGRKPPNERDEHIAFLIRKLQRTCSESKGLDDLEEAIRGLELRAEELRAGKPHGVELFRTGE